MKYLFFSTGVVVATLAISALSCKSSSSNASGADAGSDDDAGDGFICPDDGVSKGPWSLALTETGIKIRWEACKTGTDPGIVFTPEGGSMQTAQSVETPFVVHNTYGAPLNANAPKDYAGTYYMHEAALTGLSPSTCYTYSLVADPTLAGRFCTARKSGDAFTFLVIGDTNPTLEDNTTKVLAGVLPKNPDFTLHGGDIQYYDSTLETWAAWFPLMNPLLRQGALQVAIGNHESEKPDEYAEYTIRFFGGAGQDGGDGYYRFESGGVWFFSINTQDPVDGASEQGQWLLAELADAAQKPGFLASIVYFHKPFLTCGDTGDDVAAEQYWAPIFVKYHVPIVFQAHMHGYERFIKDGVTWVTAAGGGGLINDPSMNTSRDYCNTRVAVGDYYNATVMSYAQKTFFGETIDTAGKVRDSFTVPVQ